MDRKGKGQVSRRRFLKLAALGAAGYCVPFGLACTNWLKVDRRTLELPHWDADGFTIAFLSDFHLTSQPRIELAERAVRLAIEEKPDAILLGGDFVEGSGLDMLVAARDVLKLFGDAGCPVFTVLGNHDYWVANPNIVVETVAKSPVHLLRNQSAEVQGVSIAGVDDAIMRRQKWDFLRKGDHSRSLLTLLHEPDFVDESPEHVSLQLSGHSHGGQICLPGGVALHTPRGARSYVAGFYDNSKVPLFVTTGVGTTGPHLRTFCRPEVCILTLRGKQG
jgi:uncharacterized protein